MQEINRAEARSKNLTRYFTGKPCRRGHIDERLTSKGTCCECHRIATRKSYSTAEGKAKQTARHRIYRAKNPGDHAARCRVTRLAKYGLNETSFAELLTLQNNSCAICFEEFIQTPHIDHCHTTNAVRGLLCGPCNRGIGLFKDKPERLASAVIYLSNSSPSQ